MVVAMFLAHLIGDYVLQWDRLAMWKAKELKGVTAHCLVVTLTTFIFAFPFGSDWWQIAGLISIGHYFIDAVQLPITSKPPRPGMFSLFRFTMDQVAHAVVIMATLVWGGYLDLTHLSTGLNAAVASQPELMLLVGYTCLAMPTWVFLEFIIYGLVKGSAPNFAQATNKYVSSMERWLIMTCVLLGQYMLVPVVAAPRFFFEKPNMSQDNQQEVNLYVAKLLASVSLAVAWGLALQRLFS